MTKREEMRQLEEQLTARIQAVEEKERALSNREAEVVAREEANAAKEDENRETQRRLHAAAEQLRGQWDRLREEKDRGRDSLGGRPSILPDERLVAQSSINTTRPVLEERNTIPFSATGRYTRHPAFDETPSKIPVAVGVASPVPLDRLPSAGQATPLRRAATKSLGNIAAVYRGDATPAKQTISTFDRKRTSIGSPSELQYNYCEDVSMATSSIASPAIFIPRPRRSSIAPGATSSRAAGPSCSSAESLTLEQENVSPQPHQTMIPAPTHSFVYKEAATPAKWAMEDPDLPSPFLRRAPSAPVTTIIPERQPLVSINNQAVSSTSAPPVATKIGRPLIPRSRSGGLHQHVLRANAHARTSGEGVRSKPVPVTGSNRV